MARDLVLLADDMPERADVVEELIVSEGYTIVRCSTIAQCRLHLLSSPSTIRFLMANIRLEDKPLIPSIEDIYLRRTRHLPQLMLWSIYGELGVREHLQFLNEQRALIFHLPLDIDLLVRVVRLLRRRPPSRYLNTRLRPCDRHRGLGFV